MKNRTLISFSKFVLSLSLLLIVLSVSLAQGLTIGISSKNYDNDTVIIGNFYGDKQLVQDTLIAKSKKFVWKTDTMPKPGVYFVLLKPKNTYFQILINGDERVMNFEFDMNDLESVKVTGSTDNKIFNEYVYFLKDKRVFADTLRAKIDRAKAKNEPFQIYQDEFTKLDKDVKTFQDNILEQHPNYLSAILIKSNQEVTIPEFEGDEKSKQMSQYLFYKEHYFDNIPFKNLALIRTPFLHQKLDFYLNKAVSQEPDTLIKALDRILMLLDGNKDAYDYYLSYFLNTYGQLKIVGHDAIVVHIADKYYFKGKSHWSTKESLEKLKGSVDDLKPVLIGKIMPNFTTYKQDKSPVSLYDIKAKYLVMIAWDPDCGNCKKSMPFVVDFYNKYKDIGANVLSICTKAGEKANTCWPFIQEKHMESFINTGDEYQRWTQNVPNNKTPKIYILDANKKIIMKDMAGEDLDKIFTQILEFDAKKAPNSK